MMRCPSSLCDNPLLDICENVQVLIILMGATVATTLVLGLALYLPAFRRISERRRNSLHLFTAVPKSTAAAIHLQLSTNNISLLGRQKKRMDDAMEMQLEGTRSRRPALSRLTIIFVVCLVIVMMLVLSIAIAAITVMSEFRGRGQQINYALGRRGESYRLMACVQEAVGV